MRMKSGAKDRMRQTVSETIKIGGGLKSKLPTVKPPKANLRPEYSAAAKREARLDGKKL